MGQIINAAQLQSHLALKSVSAELLAYFNSVCVGVSGLVQSFTGQSFGYTKKTDIMNPPASGYPVLVVPAPIVAVEKLAVDKVVWQPVAFDSASKGYYLEAARLITRLHAINMAWPIGKRTIQITYYEGYAQSVSGVIPATPYQYTCPTAWATDLAVTIAGQPATKVVANPVAGQYVVANGVYTFAAGDTGKDFTISYAGVPPDVHLAALQIAAGIYAAKDSIGVASKSLAGQESVSFNADAIPAEAKTMLMTYKAFA